MKSCVVLAAVFLLVCGCASLPDVTGQERPLTDSIELPPVRLTGDMSVEEALLSRRSVRQYAGEPLLLNEVGQLLWAAQGITSEWGGRTAPSAGALYPIEVYLAAARVHGIDAGLYRYEPDSHAVFPLVAGEMADAIAEAALNQSSVREASAVLILTAAYDRTTVKYGERGVRYAQMEAGHVAQNVCLQATALGLGSVVVGAFEDEQLKRVLDLTAAEWPLYVIPVGRLVGNA
jgi:SagB-type dehydrogenase family enzyme